MKPASRHFEKPETKGTTGKWRAQVTNAHMGWSFSYKGLLFKKKKKKKIRVAKLWVQVGCICSLGHLLGARYAGAMFYVSIFLNAYFSVAAQLTFAEQMNSSLFRESTQI